MDDYRLALKRVERLCPEEGTSKVCALGEAIARHIEPGMTLHFGQASVRWATAAIHEIARRFWGRSPGFTLVGLGMNHPGAIFVHGGLAQKLVTSYLGDAFPTPGPNAVFQRAYRDGRLEVEHWSILTLALRLKAAAQGVSFLPTRSLRASSMAVDNRARGVYRELDDPFQAGERVGLVQALHPDITLLHGAVADAAGNTIFLPPNVENTYGAMAARKGALVTVEKIVSTDFIRSHAHLVRLPAQYVLSVSEVPFGGHPSRHPQQGLPGFEGYGDDYAFLAELKEAAQTAKSFESWVQRWVLGCRSHDDYLRELGQERLLYLKGHVQPSAWEVEVRASLPQLAARDKGRHTGAELAIVTAARVIQQKVRAAGHRTVLCGAGLANLAAWLAYYELREAGTELDIMAEAGLVGFAPRPGDPAIFNARNFPTCKMLTDVHHVMGIFASGARQRCLGSIGAGQIDRFGNINSTVLPDRRLLMVGSGGANDIVSASSEVVVTGKHHPGCLVSEVTYVTSPGERVAALVTDVGIFEKPAGRRELVLTGIIVDDAGRKDKAALVERARAGCGWDLQIADELAWIEQPTAAEIALLRLFDPDELFLGKATST